MWKPSEWHLELGVFHEGRLIGVQGIGAEHFAILRTVGTGSWLASEFQGRGIGKEMRRAVIALAFDGLRADVVLSEAFLDNGASMAVSRSLGYEENGLGRMAPHGVARDTLRFRMTRDRWRTLESERGWPPVSIEGLETSLELFGASWEWHDE